MSHILEKIKEYNEIFEFNIAKNLNILKNKLENYNAEKEKCFKTIDMTKIYSKNL